MKVEDNHSKGGENMSEKIIQLNEETVTAELKDYVRKSVMEMLNELIDNETEEFTGAE